MPGISIENDLYNACFEEGIFPTEEDIKKMKKIVEGKMEVMGYHQIIEKSLVDYFRDRPLIAEKPPKGWLVSILDEDKDENDINS